MMFFIVIQWHYSMVKRMEKKLLTYEEAGEVLGISIRTVYRLIEEKALPTVRIAARAVRIPAGAIDKFIASRTIHPSNKAAAFPPIPSPNPKAKHSHQPRARVRDRIRTRV